MPESLASKSNKELLEFGERICRSHDDRWVTLWAYNIHRIFRAQFQEREVWTHLDDLITSEWDWHLGKKLFNAIRQDTLAIEGVGSESSEYLYLLLGEAVAKCMSNASWYPGLFDVDSAFYVPQLAFAIAKNLEDSQRTEYLHYHFATLIQEEMI